MSCNINRVTGFGQSGLAGRGGSGYCALRRTRTIHRRTMPLYSPARATLCAALLASRLPAQAHEHAAAGPEKLGTVHFQTSCAPAVAVPFDHAVALLHSFEFGESIGAFSAVLASDSACAMALWGLALCRWTNPMSSANRAPALLEQGREAATAATRASAGASARERAYIAAVNRLYADYEHTTQRSRQVGYEQAMADVAAENPSDTEAQIFHAISLVATALPGDKTYANQLRAGAILEKLWAKQPDHPGLAHYIIHAYDVPALADHARIAAQRYSEIAPSAAHALHMPSHTFTRVGLWQASVNTNRRSVQAAMGESAIAEALHASDYMEYAYLQMRQDSAAKSVVDGLPAIAAHLDASAITGAASGTGGVFAIAAIPARYALERRDWNAAAALPARATEVPYADALTWFARALGSAHAGSRAGAQQAIDTLRVLQERLAARGDVYWAEQVGIQLLEARAVLDYAEGRAREAWAEMAEAATREDATEKASVTPGPLAPARELLGDMLVDLGHPADALTEYRKALIKEPNRYRSLFGAMTAAAAAGDSHARAQYASQIAKLTGRKPAS